ncbi:hypothetical protein ABK040_010593 [Willaertia magna]
MVHSYYRILYDQMVGILASPYASIHYSSNKDIIYTPLLHMIGIFNKRSNELIDIILPEDESYYSNVDYTIKHSNITCLQLSKDKNFLAAGFQNGKVFIYNLQKKEQVLFSTGHSSAVSYLAFNKDNSLLVSGGDDTDIVMWDIIASSSKFRLKGHKGRVTGLIFLEKSNALISCSKDMLIKIWELSTCHCVQTLIGSRNEIWNIVIDENEKFLLAGSVDQEIRVWDIEGYHKTNIIKPLTSEENNEENNKEDNKEEEDEAAMEEENLAFYHFDPVFLGTLKRKDETRILQMKFIKNYLILLGSESKFIEIFKVRNPLERKLKLKKSKNKELTEKSPNVVFKYRGQISSETVIRSFDFKLANKEEEEEQKNESNNTVNNNTKDKIEFYLILSTLRNSIEEFDSKSNLVKSISHMGHSSPVRDIKIASDSSVFLTLSNKEMYIWNLSTRITNSNANNKARGIASFLGRSVEDDENAEDEEEDDSSDSNGITKKGKLLKRIEMENALTCQFVPNTNNRYIIVGTKNGSLQMVDANSCEIIFTTKGHEGPVHGISIVNENDYETGTSGSLRKAAPKLGDLTGIALYTCSSDKQLKQWEFTTVVNNNTSSLGVVLTNTLEMNEEILTCKATNKYLALSLIDNTVKVFYRDSYKFLFSLYGHKLPIKSIDISSDEKLIITGSDDKNIKIWGLDFGDCHRSIFGHEQGITNLQFVYQTHYFLSTSKDGNVKYWDADNFELIQHINHSFISKSPIWCIDATKNGKTIIFSGHERGIYLFKMSNELLFLEEEEERRFEEEQLKNLPNSQQFKDISRNTNEGVEHAGRRTIETIRDGEKLMENLDVAMLGDLKHPLLMGLKIDEYVWKCLLRIARSDLDIVLSILPFSYAYFILQNLRLLLQKNYNVELITRIIIILLNIHFKQMILNENDKEMFNLLNDLNSLLRNNLQNFVTKIGYNIAALDFVKNRMKNEQLFMENIPNIPNTNNKVKSYRERQRELRKIIKDQQTKSITEKEKEKKRHHHNRLKGMLENLYEKETEEKPLLFSEELEEKKKRERKDLLEENESKKKKLQALIGDDDNNNEDNDDVDDFMSEVLRD